MSKRMAACLACPLCGAALRSAGSSAECASGHSFDVARQGYVSLLRGDAETGTADTAKMVTARERVHEAGLFGPLSESLVRVAVHHAPTRGEWCVLDVGAGTGAYTAEIMDALPGREGVALDLSKHAARRAARAHPKVTAAVADTWSRLPIADGSVGVLVDVFAPRNADEFRRVLASDGVLVVATPGPEHLSALVEALGLVTVDEAKDERLAAQLGDAFEPVESLRVRWDMRLTRADARDLVLMGPSAHHMTEAELDDRLGELDEPIETVGDVRLGVYRPR